MFALFDVTPECNKARNVCAIIYCSYNSSFFSMPVVFNYELYSDRKGMMMMMTKKQMIQMMIMMTTKQMIQMMIERIMRTRVILTIN